MNVYYHSMKKSSIKDKYELSINEALMYAIQKYTGHTTAQIVSFFQDVMVRQRKTILAVINVSDKEEVDNQLFMKKTYGFYPNTELHFVITTQHRNEVDDNGKECPYLMWECNVSLPRNMVVFDDAKLNGVLIDSILLGEQGSEPEVGKPDTRTARKRDSLEELIKQTDKIEDNGRRKKCRQE